MRDGKKIIIIILVNYESYAMTDRWFLPSVVQYSFLIAWEENKSLKNPCSS